MTETTAPESKRGRVRRLFIDRLTEFGFRKLANVSAEKHKTNLDGLADGLGYMSDHSLGVLFDMVKSKGQGRDHDGWPSRATIIALAEMIEPRPVEEMPAMLRWFKSVEGPKARAAGTLVETWVWFQRRKVPPVRGATEIARMNEENARKLALAKERIDRGSGSDEDRDLLKRYADRLAYCEVIVSEGEAARAGDGGVGRVDRVKAGAE